MTPSWFKAAAGHCGRVMNGGEAKAEKAKAAGTVVRAKAESSRRTMVNGEDEAKASGRGDQSNNLTATRARASGQSGGRPRRRRSVSRPGGSGTAKAGTGALRGALGPRARPSGFETERPVESKHVCNARRGA